MTEQANTANLIELATDLTTAWLANPNTRVSAEDVPAFLQAIHGTVASLASPVTTADVPAVPEYAPAVSVRRSLSSKDHIVSMIDGKPYKSLKRHLNTHGLTPAEYRERYGLKPDYPMVSENYAELRRSLAKKIGLGRKPGTKVVSKAAVMAVPAKAAPAKVAVSKAATAAARTAAAKPKAAKAPKAAPAVDKADA